MVVRSLTVNVRLGWAVVVDRLYAEPLLAELAKYRPIDADTIAAYENLGALRA